MDRREALILTTKIMGGSVIGSAAFLTSCKSEKKIGLTIDANIIAMLDEIGEIILPKTEQSPGAKEAKIGDFMKAIVEDCYSQKEAEVFMGGVRKIDADSKETFNKKFVELNSEQKLEILTDVDKESRISDQSKQDHFFTMMKQLCIWGYFTSQPGATQALRYNPIPGRYDACIPYEEGQKAWS